MPLIFRHRLWTMIGVVAVKEYVHGIVADRVCSHQLAVMRLTVPPILPVAPYAKITADHSFFLSITKKQNTPKEPPVMVHMGIAQRGSIAGLKVKPAEDFMVEFIEGDMSHLHLRRGLYEFKQLQLVDIYSCCL